MPQTTDQADLLIARVQAGDRAAFATLYQHHYRRIYALCVRLSGDRHVAEELTQDTFVAAWRNIGNFRHESRFETWLHRIAVNTVLGERRRRRPWLRWISNGDDAAAEASVNESPGRARDLEWAISALPERARDVFVLIDVAGHTHDEAAEILGIAAGTTKAQLSRAREKLRSMLS